MHRKPLFLLASLLFSSVKAMDFGIEANPFLMAFNLQDNYSVLGVAPTFYFSDRLSLSVPMGYSTTTTIEEEGAPEELESTVFNMNLRYHSTNGFYLGGVYRANFKHNDSSDYQWEQLRQGVGFIIGQERYFGEHWYLGYSASGGLYLYDETKILRDDREDEGDWPDVFWPFSIFTEGFTEATEKMILTVQIIQVGYRF